MDKPKRPFGWMFGVAGIAVVLAAGAAGLTTYVVWRKLEGRRIERDSHTVVEAVRKVARLTTVEMNVSSFQRRRDSKNLLGFIPIRCEKTVAVFYRGRVAAGFDLHDGSEMTITASTTPRGRHLRVDLPAPKLLYTDAPAPEVVVADGSVCNRFEPADYERLHTDARAAMEGEALGKGILTQADAHARALISSVGSALGYEVEVRVDGDPAAARGEGTGGEAQGEGHQRMIPDARTRPLSAAGGE